MKFIYLTSIFLITFCTLGQDFQKIHFLEAKLESASNFEKIEIYEELGIAYTANYRNPQASIINYDKGIEVAKKAKEIEKVANFYKLEAIVFHHLRMYDDALPFYQEALRVAERAGKMELITKCYVSLGNLYKDNGNYEAAIEYYFKALKLSEKFNLGDFTRAKILSGIGHFYKDIEHKELTMDYYNQAMEIAETHNDDNLIAEQLLVLGDLALDENKYDAALEYFLKAKEKSDILYSRVRTEIELKIGHTYLGMGNTSKAQNIFLTCLKEFEFQGRVLDVSSTQLLLGDMYLAENDLTSAEDQYKSAYLLVQNIGDRSWESIALAKLSEVSLALNNKQQALHYAIESYELINKTKSYPYQLQSTEVLAKAYLAIDDEVNAQKYMNEHKKIREMITSSEDAVVMHLATIRHKVVIGTPEWNHTLKYYEKKANP